MQIFNSRLIESQKEVGKVFLLNLDVYSYSVKNLDIEFLGRAVARAPISGFFFFLSVCLSLLALREVLREAIDIEILNQNIRI